MKLPDMDVSVVICTYTEERWEDLLAAVESVRGQNMPALETIVVVDHNPPMLERVRAEIPDVIAIANQQTRGLSGARNTGIEAAHGVIVALLDDDATADPDWLARLTAGFEDARVAIIGGAAEPRWLDGKPGWFPEEFNWVVGCSYRGMPERTTPVRNPFGGNMAFRRELYAAYGGFRSGVGRIGTRPVGCEETEFCIRIHQRQPHSLVLYEPSARIHHKVPGKRTTWRYFCARCYAEGWSKAQISRLVGAGDALSAERRYILRVLPLGVVRGVMDAVLRRDPAGLARAGAIVAGLALTTAGYLVGALSQVAQAVGDRIATRLAWRRPIALRSEEKPNG